MQVFDPKTVYLVYIVTSIISSIVLLTLWKENRERFPEIFFWLGASVLQNSCLILLLFQGLIPDFISILIANGFIVAGSMMLFLGLERFIGKNSRKWPLYLHFALFMGIHIWFTYVNPNLFVRSINTPFAFMLVTARSSWILFVQPEKEMRRITRAAAIALASISFASLAHVLLNIYVKTGADMFSIGSSNVFLIIVYLVTNLSISFNLILMVNKRTTKELLQSELKFSTTFQTSPYAMALSRLEDGALIDFNEAFITLFGYSKEELLNSDSLDLDFWIHLFDREKLVASLREGTSYNNQEIQLKTKSKEVLTCLFSAESLNLSNDSYILSSIVDITNRISMETELRTNRTFLSEIIEHSGNIICVKDIKGSYTLVNKKWEESWNLKREAILGKTDHELFPGIGGEQFRKNDLMVMNLQQDLRFEEVIETEKGTRYFLSVKFPMFGEKGSISGICAMITDITKRKQAEAKINYLADHDFLTELPSRRLAMRHLSSALEYTQAHGKQGALLYLDLDGFKKINDTLGHDAGDFVLQQTAIRLKAIQGTENTVARIGGDEFLFICKEISCRQELDTLGNTILGVINTPLYVQNEAITISASIGIVLFPKKDCDLECLIKHADKAMYTSKEKGKNICTFAC
jgi:diguanylate cyclase (GGDEF)-like protein/PAS domain S-box-containing protein